MSTELALYLPAILNAASFFGRVIPGFTADKLGRLNLLCICSVSTGILSICWQFTTTNASTIAFAAIYGFFSGSVISLISVSLTLVPKNPADIGTYLGMAFMFISVGALIGPPIDGAFVGHYHGYKEATDFSGAVMIAGGLCVLVVKWTFGKGLLAKL